ncbi:hypothetical protein SAMN05660206_103269 [Sphingobacterium wenxiniae]|uniref:Uncharacterized protein n=1 Tax=Sphingobacterium wenxiniae TaxID=683125 RepID=A0A1I6RAG1_9SPHI|nr:hypothetical protein SAMN05660206_103269 [Sphingobacterium wenxiniae]
MSAKEFDVSTKQFDAPAKQYITSATLLLASNKQSGESTP